MRPLLDAYLSLKPETENSDDVRRIACASYSWAIPSDQALDVIAQHGRIVEVGGCTGGPEFHARIGQQWEEVDSVAIPQWSGIHDHLWIYAYRAPKSGPRHPS